MKLAKLEIEPKLDDEPRNVRDPVMYNRLRVMIEEEAIKPTWGCPLYIAARKGGWLTEDQRKAGDMYQALMMDYRRSQQSDPDNLEPIARPLAYKRIERHKERYREVLELLGIGRAVVDTLVLEELNLASERERQIARDGLQLLANYFSIGNKR